MNMVYNEIGHYSRSLLVEIEQLGERVGGQHQVSGATFDDGIVGVPLEKLIFISVMAVLMQKNPALIS